MDRIFTLFIAHVFVVHLVSAQTSTVRSPATGTNVTSFGNNGWGNPQYVSGSDDTRSLTSVRGTTNYLQGTGYNFNLLATDVISGIQLDIEKRSSGVQDVVLLDNWVTGYTRTIPAGLNRCLVIMIGMENSTMRDFTNVTYGGISMQPVVDNGLGTPFSARMEAWYMLESDLLLAANTNFVLTSSGGAQVEYFEVVSSAVYANVDQFLPFIDAQGPNTTATTASYQLPQAIATSAGSCTVTGIFCGNPPSPNQPFGDAATYTVNSGFTEFVDIHTSNSGFTTSGGCFMIAHKYATVAGSERPTFTFAGSPNRQVVANLSLRRARNMDQSVRLRKAGGVTGNEKANLNVEWPLSDTYSTYGGMNDLWGSTWSYNDVNNPQFGSMISAILQNGSVDIDHMKLTVYTTSTLPVELVDFYSTPEDLSVQCHWLTASEINTDYFLVERSEDGVNFEPLGKVTASGSGNILRKYNFSDSNPKAGINYYRLKTVDNDGRYEYSQLIAHRFGDREAVTMYPNPAHEWTTLLSENDMEEITIVNLEGQIIERVDPLMKTFKLNVSQLKDGFYYICIRGREGIEVKSLKKTSR